MLRNKIRLRSWHLLIFTVARIIGFPVSRKHNKVKQCAAEFARFIQGDILGDLEHPNSSKYPGQRVFVLNIDEYVYLVPYVESEDEIFLKTIIPSRKATREYLGDSK